MTRERDKKLGKEQQLLDAARLGQFNQLETILRQFDQLKTKKRSNPLASLRKCIGPNNIRDPVTGFTCLHHAALNGHTQCVQLILNHGARLNAVDYKGSSALHLAAWLGNLQVVKVLLNYSSPSSRLAAAEAAATTTTTLTSVVAPVSHRSSSSASSASQTDDQAQSVKSSSPLARSSKQRATLDEDKHEEIELNLRNNDGQTALALAAQFGHRDVVAELLCHSADANLRNNQWESPLDAACLNGHLETVRLILNSSPRLVHDLRSSHSTAPIAIGQSLREPAISELNDVKARSGWSSLLRGSSSKSTGGDKDGAGGDRPRRASLAANKIAHKHEPSAAPGWTQQSSLDSPMAVISERLLDHSPLHYAVRKCHPNIVGLLLDQYDANLFQLTSLGSVMHEIVLNNCDSAATASSGSNATYYANGDMMKLFLAHLSRVSAGDLNETRARWNQLLSARNRQQMNVFDLINELNTRSAQEIKRNIFQLNEQIERSLKIQQQQSIQAQNYGLETEQSLKQANQGQLFSNARQINSFLTMKRGQPKSYQKPAHSLDNATLLNQLACGMTNDDGMQYHAMDGTQTIDRRRVAGGRNKNADNLDWLEREAHMLNGQAQLTRSVSNLMFVNNANKRQESMSQSAQQYGSIGIDDCKLSSRNVGQEPSMSQEQLRNVQIIQRKIDELQKRQQTNTIEGVQMRKKRSKSRDLGSLLMQVNQSEQVHDGQSSTGSDVNNSEQLYDNQAAAGSRSDNSHQENHLVRSQTDCSHLLGRLACDGAHSIDRMGQQANYATYQQQFHLKLRSSDNSSSLLATSQQDTRRLIPTTIAQLHSATLDRRAINRHYHVYDHEFYPPRLVTDQTGPIQPRSHHSHLTPAKINAAAISERQKQAAIAIVPPLVRNEPGQHHTDQSGGSTNGRLSLNIDQKPQQQQVGFEYNRRFANATERKHEQMNRQLNVDLRKSMPVQQNGNHHQSRQQSLIDADYEQQQALHNSQSFDSHFASESQQQLLFESTRQALMRDFDKMIGHELLHHDDARSSNGSLGHLAHSASSSSQSSSILTGVSLDMDTQGEHLVVSGTRVTMAPPIKVANLRSHRNRLSQQDEGCVQAMMGREVEQQQQQRVLQSSDVKTNSSGHSLLAHSSLSASSNSTASNQRKQPPQKPPRPSLRSQQIYKSLKLDTPQPANSNGSQPKRNSIIYDQPLLCPATNPRAASRTSNHSVPSPSAGPGVAPSLAQPLHTPKLGQSQNSITQPPIERPPPPPIQQELVSPMLTTPLNVITSDSSRPGYGLHAIKPISSSNSPSSSSSTSSSSRQTKPKACNSHARVGMPAGGRLVAHSVDVDSGFCTSNSPASHDSESGVGGGGGIESTNELSFSSNRSKESSRTNSVILAPPSPRTAQLSIEEALVPLERSSTTQEMANQTETVGLITNDYDLHESLEPVGRSKMSSDEDSLGLDSQVEMIFGWLGVAQDSCKDDVTNYENCIELQQTLGTSMQEPRNVQVGSESDGDKSGSQQERRAAFEQPNSCSISTDTASSLDSSIMIMASEIERIVPQPDSAPIKHDRDLSETPANCLSEDSPPRLCKEITLKVVVDGGSKLENGDEVFYINPSELKKISNSTECNKSEAQTLTEEELCASVDKDSGFIRFTLRKRRALANHNDRLLTEEIEPADGQNNELNGGLQDSHGDSSGAAKQTEAKQDIEKPQEERVRHDDSCMQVVEPTAEPVCESGADMPQKESLDKRKPSADSLRMDISQSSSSSGSSELSIKSIVSMKEQPVGTSVGENEQVAPPEGSQLESTTSISGNTSKSAEITESDQTVAKSSSVDVPKASRCSLVSEAARKVEAAAAINQQPIAAARKTLGRLDNHNTQNKSVKEKIDVRPINCPPARRSICWPPPKPGDEEEPTEDKSLFTEPSVPVIGRVMANRLSFQKLIEEKNKSNSFVPVTSRAKPPPPVKPAGLIAPQRFKSSQIN